METTGARLKRIRLEKGISLEEVHKKTKVHPDILRSIEEDSLINFNPVYIRGFVKIYCKFLGVDPKECISDYQEPKAEAAVTRQRSVAVSRPAGLTLGLLKRLALSRIARVAGMVILALLLTLVLFRAGRLLLAKWRSLPRNERQVAVARPRQAKKTAAAKPSKSQGTSVAAAEQGTETAQKITAPSSSGIRLAVRAKENCWMSLKIDGKVVFQSVLLKGRSDSWQAKEKIELSVGNAGAVDLEVNGKVIPSLGKKGQAIKNILITKEGLTTPR